MSLFLNTNLTALSAQRAVTKATNSLDICYERLSTGLKINSAKDDPAGIQTANRLTDQLNSLTQSNRNAQNAIAYAQTAEGAMEEITTMLQRIRTLSVQSCNGTYSTADREALQQEVDELNEEICRIARDTTFGGEDILSGTGSVVRFQISPDPGSVIKIDLRSGFDTDSIAELAAKINGSDTFTTTVDGTTTAYNFTDIFSYSVKGKGIDISTASSSQVVLAGIDSLINAIDTKRAELGAIQNRLESSIRNQETIYENVSDSRSLIQDADYAEEVANMASQQVIQQAAVSILTQANTKPEIALQMLQSG